MKRTLAWSLPAAWLLLGCTPGLAEPTTAHLGVAQKHEPEVTLDDLTRGRSLYVSKCVSCHALKDPSSLAPEAWAGEVEHMRVDQGVKLTDDQARDIVRYLHAASQVGRSG